MADKKSKLQVSDLADNGAEAQLSLGKLISEARERKGLTRDQVISEAHLPAHYVKMIETDNYDLISDRLYLVPFLRRYATFLGLDAEEVASRFVSNVQHAEANVVRISQEITVVSKQPRRAGRIAFVVLTAAVIFLLVDFVWRRFVEHGASNPAAVASPAAISPAPGADAATPPRQEPTGINPAPALPVSAPANSIAPPSAHE